MAKYWMYEKLDSYEEAHGKPSMYTFYKAFNMINIPCDLVDESFEMFSGEWEDEEGEWIDTTNYWLIDAQGVNVLKDTDRRILYSEKYQMFVYCQQSSALMYDLITEKEDRTYTEGLVNELVCTDLWDF